MADEQEPTEEDVDDTTGGEEETEAAESETDETADVTAEDEWKPPTREEWEKLQKAQKDAADKLAKVNKESTQRRLKIRDLERQGEDEAAKAKREAEEAAMTRFKPYVIRDGLRAAQVRADRVDAVIKLVNLDLIEVGDNGEVHGLDVEVERIKELLPEVFIQSEPEKPEAAPAPKPAPRAQAASKKPAREEPK